MYENKYYIEVVFQFSSALSNQIQLFQLLDDFDSAQLENDLVYRLVSFHSGTTHLSEYDIGRVFFHIGENFRQFAVKQSTFQVTFNSL